MRALAPFSGLLLSVLLVQNAEALPCINDNASKQYQPAFAFHLQGEQPWEARISEFDETASTLPPPQFLAIWTYNPAGEWLEPKSWFLDGALITESLTPPSSLPGGMPSRILLNDVNADGRTDLLVGLGPYLLYYQGFSGARFGRLVGDVIDETRPQQAVVVASPMVMESFFSRPQLIDANGDNEPDLLVAHSDGLSLWLQSAGQFGSRQELITGIAVEAVAVLDLNGDSLDDIALVSSGELQTRLNNGQGGFTVGASQSLAALPEAGLVRLHTPVLNGGGKDLVLENTISQVWLMTAQGLSSSENITSPHGILLADVDDDGDIDLLPKQGLAICGSTEEILPGWRNDGSGQLLSVAGNYADESMWQLANIDGRDGNGAEALDIFFQLNDVLLNGASNVDTSAFVSALSGVNNGEELLFKLQAVSGGRLPVTGQFSLRLRYPEAAWVVPDSPEHNNATIENCSLVTPADLAADEVERECLLDGAEVTSGMTYSLLLNRVAMEQRQLELSLSLPQQQLDIDPTNNRLVLRLGSTQDEATKKPSTLLGTIDGGLLLFMLMFVMRRYIFDLACKYGKI